VYFFICVSPPPLVGEKLTSCENTLRETSISDLSLRGSDQLFEQNPFNRGKLLILEDVNRVRPKPAVPRNQDRVRILEFVERWDLPRVNSSESAEEACEVNPSEI